MTEPNKVTQVGPSPPSPRGATPARPHPHPEGTDPVLPAQSQAFQCLGGSGPCAMSNRSSGATGLELSLHPCTILGGGMDGGVAARAGHLLPGLLVTGLGRLEVRGLSRLPEG